jgi:hypothetical protein
MRSRFALYALVATLLVGGFAVVADALVISDSERLDQLADDLATRHERTDVVLRSTDLSREPVTVTTDGDVQRFREDDEQFLAETVSTAFERLGTSELDVIQRSVHVEGDHGTIALRVRANGGTHDANVRLTRNGQGWLITALRVR